MIPRLNKCRFINRYTLLKIIHRSPFEHIVFYKYISQLCQKCIVRNGDNCMFQCAYEKKLFEFST